VPGTGATDYGFREIPITFDLYSWKQGAALKSELEIEMALAVQIRAGDPIGILLHHKVLTPEALEITGRLLGHFKRSPAVRMHTFESAMKCLPRKGERQ
jgi:hypothetical protein